MAERKTQLELAAEKIDATQQNWPQSVQFSKVVFAHLGLCESCGQKDIGQTGEYACPDCKLPMTWDSEPIFQGELDTAIKQARAEVLAACQERIDLFLENIGRYSDEFGKKKPFKTWDRADWEAAALRLLTDVQDALDELQPAAKDLEELLREEREKVSAPIHAWYDKLFYAWKADNRALVTELLKSGPGLTTPELEKARATLEKK